MLTPHRKHDPIRQPNPRCYPKKLVISGDFIPVTTALLFVPILTSWVCVTMPRSTAGHHRDFTLSLHNINDRTQKKFHVIRVCRVSDGTIYITLGLTRIWIMATDPKAILKARGWPRREKPSSDASYRKRTKVTARIGTAEFKGDFQGPVTVDALLEEFRNVVDGFDSCLFDAKALELVSIEEVPTEAEPQQVAPKSDLCITILAQKANSYFYLDITQ